MSLCEETPRTSSTQSEMGRGDDAASVPAPPRAGAAPAAAAAGEGGEGAAPRGASVAIPEGGGKVVVGGRRCGLGAGPTWVPPAMGLAGALASEVDEIVAWIDGGMPEGP